MHYVHSVAESLFVSPLKNSFGDGVQRDFHPAVPGTAFGGIVAGNGIFFTMADCGEALLGYTPAVEIERDRRSAFFR
jgi:hypothetical protein